jgi:hypothetical protein
MTSQDLNLGIPPSSFNLSSSAYITPIGLVLETHQNLCPGSLISRIFLSSFLNHTRLNPRYCCSSAKEQLYTVQPFPQLPVHLSLTAVWGFLGTMRSLRIPGPLWDSLFYSSLFFCFVLPAHLFQQLVLLSFFPYFYFQNIIISVTSIWICYTYLHPHAALWKLYPYPVVEARLICRLSLEGRWMWHAHQSVIYLVAWSVERLSNFFKIFNTFIII